MVHFFQSLCVLPLLVSLVTPQSATDTQQQARAEKSVTLELGDAQAEVPQWSPVFLRWTVANRGDALTQFTPPVGLFVEQWSDGAWIDPYKRPRMESPRASAARMPRELQAGGRIKGELEFVDIAIVSTPGRYRVQARMHAGELDTPQRQLRSHLSGATGRQLVASNWLEFDITPHAGNAALAAELESYSPSRIGDLRAVLYAGGYDTSVLGAVRPPFFDRSSSTHESAWLMLARDCSEGLALKSRMWLAQDETARGAYFDSVHQPHAAAERYAAALTLAREARVDSPGPAQVMFTPAALALEIHSLRALGQSTAAEHALALARSDWPEYFAARPQIAQRLEGRR